MAKAGDIFCLWFAPEQVWIALQVWKPHGIPERRPDETDIDKMNRKSTGVMLLDWHSSDFPTLKRQQRISIDLIKRENFWRPSSWRNCMQRSHSFWRNW
ncbi:MAG: hypothetical protein IJN57_04780 [Oscillospiraceae bacterium]|nr:hypothetical protein [Oscillospiraceae bacterium]MBQ7003269.1 hypothetical protein [Oscillospiraceae bacterium]